MEKGYVFFGKHILSTTYPPLPIDKEFKFKLSPTSAVSAIGKKNTLDKIQAIVKSTVKTSIIAYVVVIITIEDIYNALAILAHIDDTAMSDTELMQFLSTLYQPSIMEAKSWNLQCRYFLFPLCCWWLW